MNNSLLEQVETFISERIKNFSDKIVYHDLSFAHRLIQNIEFIGSKSNASSEDLIYAKIVAWFFCAGFEELEVQVEEGTITDNNEKLSLKYARKFFSKHPVEEHVRTKIETHLKGINFFRKADHLVEKIVSDAITIDIVDEKKSTNLKLIYQELLLNNVSISKLNWYETIIKIAEDLKFYTEYCQNELPPRVALQIESLKKERDKMSKQADKALRKELDITDKELNKLKKNLKNLTGRDDRAIQTLFRTTSKNHYTLNEMVDRKASIMITVNSIILSVVISGMVEKQGFEHQVFYIPIVMLTLASTFSIIFAVLSTRPNKTHGKFTESEIRSKQGNLLYYGNFHQMGQRDYQWGMLQMMNDADYLYSSMIRDLYFLGQTLEKKYRYIRISLNVFLSGFIFAIVSFAFFRIIVHL